MMNISIHSSVSTTSDVVVLPSINNHMNYINHKESTNKSFKRSRSASLIPDDNDDSNHFSTIKETSTKKSRKKRTTIDIDQSLGRNLSADKLHVYRWPTGEPHADLHVLQEQICDYLSLKSFKRKYPDIYRRIVDLHEREYLKSQNVVTETQCDLGLTALKLDEVLQLMSIDYPEKCHQFNHVWQQKRRALLSNNNNGVVSSSVQITNSNQISSSISNVQSTNSFENGEKTRVSKVRQDLLRSTVEFNSQLQRERIQDRKSCFDLQTMQIHFPENKQLKLPSHLTKIGSYPLSLLPGQFQDSYIKYKSNELKYMPVNTALFYYPKPISFVRSERFSNQIGSSDEEDENLSTIRFISSNQQRPSTPKSPLVTNGIGNGNFSKRLEKVSTSIFSLDQLNFCHICKISSDEQDENLVQCTNCQHNFHPVCLEVNNEMLNIIKTYRWQCIDCKSCAKCNKTHDEANMMFCDRCDRGYHTYCVGLEFIPDGSWQCSHCDSSSSIINIKNKRGRPSMTNRSSLQQSINSLPTRFSSRRNEKIISTSLSQTNHSSNSSSTDFLTTNSSSMNLILTPNSTTNSSISTEIKKAKLNLIQ